MSVESSSWERRLLDWAYQGLQNARTRFDAPADARALAAAYARSEALTRAHSRTFYLASALLPAAKRRAARALYAFCRISDDLVDQEDTSLGAAEARLALENWRRRTCGDASAPESAATLDLDVLAWADTRRRYGIPAIYAEQLIAGVARDLTPTRYGTFDDVASYCYGVASTVGLMAMHIIGFSGSEAIPYAVKLGVALQLTNILRDVGEDWRMGRVYLPQDELAAFGVSEEDIALGQVTERWRDLMRFQIARVRRLYAESVPGIRLLHPDGRMAIGAAAELYCAILDDIEAHDMQVFTRRAHLGTWRKLARLPGIWWRTRVTGYP